MTRTTSAVKSFISTYDFESLAVQSLDSAVKDICCSQDFEILLLALIESPAFSQELGQEFSLAGNIEGLSACRRLRSSLNLNLNSFFSSLAELLTAFDQVIGFRLYAFANQLQQSDLGTQKLLDYLRNSERKEYYQELAHRLVQENPHAIYPTSNYRESRGFVESTSDDQVIEAVMRSSTFTSIRVIDNCLDPEELTLRDIYVVHKRCVCLVDQNVERFYGELIDHYFEYHDIHLEKLVYRGMEVDKSIYTVEKMLGDFKHLGVSRNEPVLIIGGGVIADTGGLACALYHRNTPYVMLSTSIVAGIDAGPSPRTCCDGFGYKNLFGAYHPPILSITDRYFFKTLRKGWLRHGIIEIIKMAVTKDAQLFSYLEKAGPKILDTHFGTVECETNDQVNILSQKILGAALRSYVAAEYDNLYETHQCRPHAYGHTWSPGFEIETGLLHGHAVAIGMGFGAYLSYRLNWISGAQMKSIHSLVGSFGLSLWHDIMLNKETLWSSQVKIIQKRGGNLAAPLPKNEIGQCGYLNSLSQAELYEAIDEYQAICQQYPRQGLGIEAHCRDVGLGDPSTIDPRLDITPSTESSAPALSSN